MELPNSDRALVDRSKITDYLLALDHPEGSSKAQFFERFGFKATAWEILAEALIAHARANAVASMFQSKYGTKYRIEGPLVCPDGRSPSIRAVWIIDAGSDVPRLVTAHPL